MSYVTVSQLRDELSGWDDDLPIVLSSDAEGNSFSPFSDTGEAWYSPETSWSGEIWNEEDLDGDMDGVIKVLVFWPVN